MTQPLVDLLQPSGVTAVAYTPAPFDYQIPYLGINSGMVNLNNGSGFMSLGGQIVVSSANNGNVMTINALSFEPSPTGGVVTGNMSINNHYIVRLIVLMCQANNPLKAPFNTGVLQVGGMPATLSDGMLKTMASQFGLTIPPSTVAAMLEINTAIVGVNQQ